MEARLQRKEEQVEVKIRNIGMDVYVGVCVWGITLTGGGGFCIYWLINSYISNLLLK